MSGFSVEKPIKFESLVSNLSARDLRANLAVPSLWEKLTGLLPTGRVSTYHAVTDRPDQEGLMGALTRMGVLENGNRQHTTWSLAGGFLKLDCWPVLKKEIKSRIAGLELVSRAVWPMIVPDVLAQALVKTKR